ncbi:kazrin [Python bivittatus]|uniref:Kazrin n=1 Tax=Python bivittatus TaxID=176946 RepID=A0A9F5IU49_PYTBI|nr:kazrin [Python bivittatus]
MKSESEENRPVLLREEVSQLQEEIHLLRQMKEMLTKDLEETHGGKSTEILSATELRVQLAQKEQELARAKEALQASLSAPPESKQALDLRSKEDGAAKPKPSHASLRGPLAPVGILIDNPPCAAYPCLGLMELSPWEGQAAPEPHRRVPLPTRVPTPRLLALLFNCAWTALGSPTNGPSFAIRKPETEVRQLRPQGETAGSSAARPQGCAPRFITFPWPPQESEDAVKALAKEKDLLEREKWELRRQAKEATDHASALRSQLDLKDNRMKELEAELAMAKQSLATLTKDVPKRHSLAMPGETVLNGNQEWVMQADLPLTAAIRQSQQTLYHAHPQHTVDRQAVRVSPCHSRQPSIISDASAAEGDRSSTPSDINSPRHRTHSLCNGDSPGPVQKNLHNPIVQSLEDLEDQKRKKKKEKMGFGSISRVFARGKQRKSLDPGVFDGTAPDYYIEEDADW